MVGCLSGQQALSDPTSYSSLISLRTSPESLRVRSRVPPVAPPGAPAPARAPTCLPLLSSPLPPVLCGCCKSGRFPRVPPALPSPLRGCTDPTRRRLLPSRFSRFPFSEFRCGSRQADGHCRLWGPDSADLKRGGSPSGVTFSLSLYSKCNLRCRKVPRPGFERVPCADVLSLAPGVTGPQGPAAPPQALAGAPVSKEVSFLCLTQSSQSPLCEVTSVPCPIAPVLSPVGGSAQPVTLHGL